MSTTTPRIALISAVTSAWAPAHRAFAHAYPEAALWNLLDDHLLTDADAAGGLTAPLRARMERLIDHALAEGADAVLLTCSLYGPVAHAHAAAASMPLHGPDDALFAEVARRAPDRAVLVSSGSAPLADSARRLAAGLGAGSRIVPVLAEDAAAANRAGDAARVLDAVVHAVRGSGPLGAGDLVVLGQYSLAPIAEAAAARLGCPVLSGPALAVAALRDRLSPDRIFGPAPTPEGDLP